jgi:nucleoside-diphosphate-sugar epimerase
MRVLVTGGTGFVGSHAVAALRAAGHEVRLLVRSPERVGAALAPLGANSGLELVHGDVTDQAAVGEALRGCDAVLHAAAVYSFDPRDSTRVRATNVLGTELVLEQGKRLGLDPIVQLSTFGALLPAPSRPLVPGGPLGHSRSPYLRSKVEQEAVARRLQKERAPVVIIQPGSVWGPHDPNFGESDQMAHTILTRRMPIVPSGGFPIVDVRDVASALARVFHQGQGPRSYLLGGHYVRFQDLVRLLGEVTGRRLPALPLSETVILPLAHVADLAQRVLPFRLPLPTEGIWLTKHRARCDDSPARAELSFAPRELRETIADTVRSLVAEGRLSAKQAGPLAGASA